ncbi:MAG: metallophosphoesterase [Magnetococcales bacterium]|nr:metallophosphoesterase [Magnetococcales bacterium]
MTDQAPLLILHLSDLHFGDGGRFAGEDPGEFGRRFADQVRAARGEAQTIWKVPSVPDTGLVIVTGDVANSATEEEYEQAHKFFSALADGLKIPHMRFVFVPGNHDVSWPNCEIAILQLKKKTKKPDETLYRQEMDAVKFEIFNEFIKGFLGHTRQQGAKDLGNHGLVHDFPDLRLSIAAINSCERESHRDEDHLGQVSREQAQSLLNIWKDPKYSHWLKIITFHHNPEGTVIENVDIWKKEVEEKGRLEKDQVWRLLADTARIDGLDELKRVARQAEVQVVLHGHQHANAFSTWSWKKPGNTQVLSTGSLWADDKHLPRDHPHACQLVLLSPCAREGSSIHVLPLRYHPQADTDGHVQAGSFVPDSNLVYHQTMVLPEGFCSGGSATDKPPPVSEPDAPTDDWIDDFVTEYRQRLKARFGRWEFSGVVAPGGAVKPLDVALDDMYLSLRFGENTDPDVLDDGQVIGPDALLARTKPLVIRGGAGTGKTTWMRWSFRQLLDRKDTLPVFLELRALSALWQGKKSALNRNNLDDVIVRSITADGVASAQASHILSCLARQDGPLPVLLVDGWDELGEFGRRFRELLLGFMQTHPRLRVVVSSRPYGDAKPDHDDGFELLDIQPLDDAEIDHMTYNFFTRRYQEDAFDVEQHKNLFLKELHASPEAESLARTAFLLTMLLIVCRFVPLPENRHELYYECVKYLLITLPDKRAQEGVLLPSEYYWCPPDGKERLRVVAALASDLQNASDFQNQNDLLDQKISIFSRVSIICSWKKMAASLPESWEMEKKNCFLAWLVGPAGLLTDRSDGTLSFIHLSFQEFLTAWHLDKTTNGKSNCIDLCNKYIGKSYWWNTMRLWAALVQMRNNNELSHVLIDLLNDAENGVWFVGAVLADGLGLEEVFHLWLKRALDLLQHFLSDNTGECFSAWRNCRHKERSQKLTEALYLEAEQKTTTWCYWQRLAQVCSIIRIAEPPRPVSAIVLFMDMLEVGSVPNQAGHVALGRILNGGIADWPGSEVPELVWLNFWPGHRRLAGLRYQSLAINAPQVSLTKLIKDDMRCWSSGANLFLANNLALSEFINTVIFDIVYHFVLGSECKISPDVIHNIIRTVIPDVARYIDCYLVRDAKDVAHKVANFIIRHVDHIIARDTALDNAHDFFSPDFARDFARSVARDWNLDADESGVMDFVTVELVSFGRIGPGFILCHAEELPTNMAEGWNMFQEACRVHYRHHRAYKEQFLALTRAWQGDLLWSSLARHVARCSSKEDQALLLDLAQHPEKKRKPPLSWGLQFIVRGDVMLFDGSVRTLDELYAEAGETPPPYLEAHLPPLEVDWGKEDN